MREVGWKESRELNIDIGYELSFLVLNNDGGY